MRKSPNYVGTFSYDSVADVQTDQDYVAFLKVANRHLREKNASYRLRLKRRGRGANRVARAMDYYTNRYPMLLSHSEEYRHRVVANLVSTDLPLCCAEKYDLYLLREPA